MTSSVLQKKSRFLESLDFEYETRFSVPCNVSYNSVRFGKVALAVITKFVDCASQCRPRSNLHFVNFLQTTFKF